MYWYLPCFVLAFLISVIGETQFNIITQNIWFIYICFAAVICLYTLKRKIPKLKPIICLVLGFAIGAGYTTIYRLIVQIPITMLDGGRADVVATVIDYPEVYESEQRVTLKIDVSKSELRMKIPSFYTISYLPLTEEPLEVGDIVKIKLKFYIGNDDGGFDREKYYSGRNVHILSECAYGPTFKTEKSGDIPILLQTKIWANKLKTNLEEHLNELDAGFMKGMLFGDKTSLSEYVSQDFQKSGLSHILAVSGMHIGFIVMLFTTVMGKRYGLIAAFIMLIFFVPMTGASPSVVRASIMYAVSALAFYIRKDNSMFHSLCIALFVLLVYNPYAVQSVSLQLSFLAMLGIIVLEPRIKSLMLKPLEHFGFKKKAKHRVNSIISVISCSIGVSIFTVPILILQFGYLSAASILANILTVSIFAIIFILGFILCFVGGIGFISKILAFIIHIFCSYVYFIADFCGNLSGALLSWDYFEVKVGICTIYTVIIIWLIFRSHHKIMFTILSAAIIYTLAVNTDFEKRNYEVKLLGNSGQTIAISAGKEYFALIDCSGSSYQSAAQDILLYMDMKNHEQIDMLIITSLDNTHARTVPELLNNVYIKEIILPDTYLDSDIAKEIIDKIDEKQIPLTYWTNDGEKEVSNPIIGLSVLGGTDRKLGVRIKQGEIDILTMHSFTSKMAYEHLQEFDIQCKDLIVSDDLICGDERSKQVISTLKPKNIYIPSDFTSDGMFLFSDVTSTKRHGDIIFKTLIPKEVYDGK